MLTQMLWKYELKKSVKTGSSNFFASSLVTVIVAIMSLVPAYGGDK